MDTPADADLHAALAATRRERDEYQRLWEAAQHELERLRRQLFGRKAEHVDPAQVQLAFASIPQVLAGLLGDAMGATPDGVPPAASAAPESASAPPAPPPDGTAPAPERDRGRRGRRPVPEHLPVERIELLPPGVAADPTRVRIGEDVTETLEWRASSFVRVQLVRPRFAVRGDPTAGVVLADLPPRPIERGAAGPGLLAHVLVSKYGDHLPLHRQSAIFARHGVHLARSTLCDWVGGCAALLRRVTDAMLADAVARAHCIAIDATGVLVQAPDRCRRGHFWVLVADREHVLFRYTPKHNSDGPLDLLRGFRGYLLADAAAVYHQLYRECPVTEVGCWAHARRGFFEALWSDRERALVALGFVQQLYAADAATRGLAPAERTAARAARAGPVLAAFAAWLDAEQGVVLPRSPLGGAIQYARNQWAALTRFVEDGRLSLDNNVAERELRRQVVGRHNWLFVGSDDGAEWNATVVSLIASCRLHDVEPWAYLRDVLALLPQWPASRVLELAPKAWKQTREQLQAEQLAGWKPP